MSIEINTYIVCNHHDVYSYNLKFVTIMKGHGLAGYTTGSYVYNRTELVVTMLLQPKNFHMGYICCT